MSESWFLTFCWKVFKSDNDLDQYDLVIFNNLSERKYWIVFLFILNISLLDSVVHISTEHR